MTTEEPTYSVADLASAVSRSVDRSFPDEIWVRGEIRDLSRPASGHRYFSLVDPDAAADAPAPAVLPVTLFATDREAVNRALIRAGAGRFEDGVEVRIRGRLGYYAPRGTVQLRMTWIDTDYTLGRLAAERERLIRALAAEGLLERNATLAVPMVPAAVGLVTSAGSAAEADFLHELEASGFGFKVVAADTRVQGAESEVSIIASLAGLAGRGVDLVALVRGGGSRSDLAAFDREAVARAIATCRVPVFTGIGHEVDETVADRVAARSFKTPTACAAGIVGLVGEFVGELGERSQRIRVSARAKLTGGERGLMATGIRLDRAAASRLRQAMRSSDRARGRLGRAAPRAVRAADRRIRDAGRRVGSLARRHAATNEVRLAASEQRLHRVGDHVGRAEQGVELRATRVNALDPDRILARGWSLTRDSSGRLIRSVEAVGIGDGIVTDVADGVIASRVEALQSDEHDDTITSEEAR